MIWSFLPFWPGSIYWKRQGLVRCLDCKQFLFFVRFSEGIPPALTSVSRLQSRAWLLTCLVRFARRTKKKERLLEVRKTPYRDSAKSFANERKRKNIELNRLDVALAWNACRWKVCRIFYISADYIVRVLSRIYHLGEKSWVAEGDKPPRAVAPPPTPEWNLLHFETQFWEML